MRGRRNRGTFGDVELRSRLPVKSPPLVDIVVALALVALGAVEAVVAETTLPPIIHAAVALPALALLAFRRQFPVAVAMVLVAANLATNPTGEFSTLLALVLASFTIGLEARPPRHIIGLAVLVAAMLGVSVSEGVEPSDVAAAVVFLVGPWMLGLGLRERYRHAQEAIERAERLEREQSAATAAAIEHERTRIARELHDIVSHSISVIAIQTQAVRRRLHDDQELEKDDLAAVEATARQALAEMRRLFGVLRSDGERVALAPQPGLGEIERLVDNVRSAGLDVELRLGGERAELSPGVDLAAYRIVQEGLTNALRHAQATRATVDVRYGDGELEVAVEDDGVGPVAEADGGHGLVGIRERVALYSGTLSAGAGASGGFRLAARLPTRERA
jgi:signal transduction histidine kinase